MFSRTKFTKPPKEPISYARKIPKHHKKPLFEPETVVLPPKVPVIPKQKFDYFLVLDIEATCDSPVNVDPQLYEEEYEHYRSVVPNVWLQPICGPWNTSQ
ncbi:hypothetical protein AVEN_193459-1 [Araneus ventricosus]|uniref:Exonuclease domain-containing protein n=1 Tax=Araneus ventricosus TaxID=182803 RepID=A0A4Y2TNE7_ARAVE|nr:hypothetical protein AVEN_193459-1 [Araneus ventricosus]